MAFLSPLLQLQLLQCRPQDRTGDDDGGAAVAVATTLQTLSQLARDHGARFLLAAEHATATSSDDDSGSHAPPPLLLLALRLAEPPPSSSSCLQRGALVAHYGYDVQLAAVDVLGSVAAHVRLFG